MEIEALRELLDGVRSGRIDTEAALRTLRHLPFAPMGFANIDHHRALRCGMPEVIYGPGKTPEQIVHIFAQLAQAGHDVMVTRTTPEVFALVQEVAPGARYEQAARAVVLKQTPAAAGAGLVAVVSAGTSDVPVAEEARVTAEMLGAPVETFYDIGVAGLHRLLSHHERITQANVVVVVAGMEGALASVVAGLVAAPVIAVPTSVGYGASFGGVTALLAMLNSCASSVSVVNIDNGFGAGCIAAKINRLAAGGGADGASPSREA